MDCQGSPQNDFKCWEKFTFYSLIVNEIEIFLSHATIQLGKYKIGKFD